jgi:hypothetical protein
MAAVAWRLLRKAVAFEVLMWRSLYRWVFRRPLTREPGAATFGYATATAPIMWTFIVLNAIEIPALHLILPWPTARGILDVAGVYGLLWMIGMLASRKVNPHVLGGTGMLIHTGGLLTVPLDWEDVAAVRVRKRTLSSGRTVQVDDAALSITVLSQTNVDMVLRQPTTLTLSNGATHTVTEVRLFADDPASLVARAERCLSSSRTM